jgi:hypothetical protein
VREVIAGDGASRALGAPERMAGDETLTARACGTRRPRGHGALARPLLRPAPRRRGRGGALAADLETAAVLAVARRRGIRAAAMLAVVARTATSASTPRRSRMRGVRLGRAALAALAPTPA